MKVVQELVAYFDRRGQLSKKEVRQLLDKGYLAADAPPHMLELGSSGLFSLRFPDHPLSLEIRRLAACLP